MLKINEVFRLRESKGIWVVKGRKEIRLIKKRVWFYSTHGFDWNENPPKNERGEVLDLSKFKVELKVNV